MARRTWLPLVGSTLATALVLVATGCGGGGSGKAPAPTVSGITPATGTVGTVVSLSGANFTGTPTVTFTPAAGGAAVQAVLVSATTAAVEAQVPALDAAPGSVYGVTVTNSDGQGAGLSSAFTMAAPVVTDLNGGLSGSGTVNSLFVVDGANFGDLTVAPPAGYTVDFRDVATGAVLASAAVAFTGGDWQNIFVVATVPSLPASTTYDVTLTTPSGTSAARKFAVVASVSFSPSTIAWASTAPLTTAAQGFPAVVAPISVDSGGTTVTTSYLYALGGNTGTAASAIGKQANVASVSFDRLSDSPGGSLAGAWTATAPLPAARGFSAAVAANGTNSLVPGYGNLYVLGGLDDAGAATGTVTFASLNADGTIPTTGAGAWAATTPLPQPLYAHGAVLFHGRIYVAGGYDATGAPVAKVWSAKIAADGTLGAWRAELDLPVALAYHQLLSAAGYLYVVGGTTTANVEPLSTAQSAGSSSAVYLAQINIRNGGLKGTAWTTNSASTGKSREKFSAVVAGSYVLLSGGLYNGVGPSGSSEQSYAAIATDGSVGSFNGATGAHTIASLVSGGYAFFNHAAAYYVDAAPAPAPHVLVIGGEDVGTGTPQASVWYQH